MELEVRCPEVDPTEVAQLVDTNKRLSEALRAISSRTGGRGVGTCLIHREIKKIAEAALAQAERVR